MLDEGEEEDNHDSEDLQYRYLLCAYNASDTVSDLGDTLVNKTDMQ